MEDHGSINYWGLIANLQHGDVEPNIFGGVPVVARQPRGKKRPPLGVPKRRRLSCKAEQ